MVISGLFYVDWLVWNYRYVQSSPDEKLEAESKSLMSLLFYWTNLVAAYFLVRTSLIWQASIAILFVVRPLLIVVEVGAVLFKKVYLLLMDDESSLDEVESASYFLSGS